jgi:hypothetical protein
VNFTHIPKFGILGCDTLSAGVHLPPPDFGWAPSPFLPLGERRTPRGSPPINPPVTFPSFSLCCRIILGLSTTAVEAHHWQNAAAQSHFYRSTDASFPGWDPAPFVMFGVLLGSHSCSRRHPTAPCPPVRCRRPITIYLFYNFFFDLNF